MIFSRVERGIYARYDPNRGMSSKRLRTTNGITRGFLDELFLSQLDIEDLASQLGPRVAADKFETAVIGLFRFRSFHGAKSFRKIRLLMHLGRSSQFSPKIRKTPDFLKFSDFRPHDRCEWHASMGTHWRNVCRI